MYMFSSPVLSVLCMPSCSSLFSRVEGPIELVFIWTFRHYDQARSHVITDITCHNFCYVAVLYDEQYAHVLLLFKEQGNNPLGFTMMMNFIPIYNAYALCTYMYEALVLGHQVAELLLSS